MKQFYIDDLPPKLTNEELINLHKKNNEIMQLLRKLDVLMSYGIVNSQIINSFRMHEALESTRIEGTQTTMQEMFEAKANKSDNRDIREVQNYLNALELGKNRVNSEGFIASRTIKSIHETLLAGDVRGANCDPGSFRKLDEIWIGKKGSTRATASYIPPSNVNINDYMANLEKFINEDIEFPSIIAVAIAHAQFESIHPFLDGNGRVGRILIPLMFQLKGDNTLSNLFISKQLEINKYKYYDLLNGTRMEVPEWYHWIIFFMESVEETIKEAIQKYDAIVSLYREYEDKNDLSYTKVLDCLFCTPIVTINDVMKESKLSRPTVTRVLNDMVDKKNIYKSDEKRNVKYFFYDLLRVM